MNELLSGLLVAEYATIALFFLRFWTASRDRLFVMFSAAFGVLAVQRLAIALTHERLESGGPLYLLRLGGFIWFIVAIVYNNRG